MVHGPCGKDKPNAPCMFNKDGEVTQVCHKSFPKSFTKETLWDEALSYPLYKRKMPNDGGSEAFENNRVVDNSWIVPYSPYILLRYNCHCNVEVCCSPKVTKYLFKYLTKGSDRTMIRVDANGDGVLINEAKEYQDLKSFGASESIWRICEFEMSDRYPSVKKLPVHLEKQQPVYMFEEPSLEEVVERQKNTELTAFFDYNKEHPRTQVPYIDFPKSFIFEKRQWKIRKQGTETLGRIYSIHPSKGDVFYLRVLLCDTTYNHSAGKTSYNDLKTVNGVEYETFKDACRALGLLTDGVLWRLVMEDVKLEKLPRQMRELFVVILTFTDISDPKTLFDEYHEAMSEDFEAQLLAPDNADESLLKDMLLIDIEERLQSTGNEVLFQVSHLNQLA